MMDQGEQGLLGGFRLQLKPKNRQSHCHCKGGQDLDMHQWNITEVALLLHVILVTSSPKWHVQGLVLMLQSDTENLEKTQERTRKLSQG